MDSSKKSSTLLAVVLLVVGLGVGFGVSKATEKKTTNGSASTSMSSTAPTSATKAADLRAALVSYGTEHMDLTNAAVAGALGGAKDASAVGADLYKNGTNIGAAVGSIYGKDAETTFNTVWKLHLDQFVAYAVAGSKGDEAGKKAALVSIDTNYTKPLAAYLAKANKFLPQDVLYSSLSEHVTMTAQMIDDQVKGDYPAAQALRAQGVQHLDGLFSTLAEGIVKQFPDKFQN
jgi:hypothetical protein